VSMWISGNQRLSLYHMAHVAQGAWTLNKSIDHDTGVCSPGWSFFVSSNPQLMKFCVGKCTAVSAFQPVLQGPSPRCRVEGTDSSTCPFVTTKEMSGSRLPYKELPMLLRLAPGILCEISWASVEHEIMLCKVPRIHVKLVLLRCLHLYEIAYNTTHHFGPKTTNGSSHNIELTHSYL
jgi:hypothetical protein